MSQVSAAIIKLNNDELVAIPTETVYGLAANAFSEKAVRKIYELKGRPSTNPLIVHIAELSKLDKIAQNIPDIAYELARQFWPGPLTLILNRQDHITSIVIGGKNTVGIRIPNHPLTLELLQSLDFPIVAPSANRSNHISPTHPDHVKISFGDRCPFILKGGRTTKGIESTIVGFKEGSPVIYRHGAISQEQIESFLHRKITSNLNEDEIIAPGMMKKHYSPSTKLILTHNISKEIKKHSNKNIGVLLNKTNLEIERNYPTKVFSPKGELLESMKNLYNHLYELERMNLDLIIAEAVQNEGVGIAINDKLFRASN